MPVLQGKGSESEYFYVMLPTSAFHCEESNVLNIPSGDTAIHPGFKSYLT